MQKITINKLRSLPHDTKIRHFIGKRYVNNLKIWRQFFYRGNISSQGAILEIEKYKVEAGQKDVFFTKWEGIVQNPPTLFDL